jgi:hypothetical protein
MQIKKKLKYKEIRDLLRDYFFAKTRVNLRYIELGYNGENLAVYDCEFLEMLRH